LTDAQIKALPTTTPLIVPVPPIQSPALINIPVIGHFDFEPWFADYTNIDPASTMSVDNPAGLWITQGLTFNPVSILLAAGHAEIVNTPVGGSFGAHAKSDFAGALSIITTNGALGNFTGGRSSQSVNSEYSLLSALKS
jgi:hypothetical protein